jgi:hypothetical protein
MIFPVLGGISGSYKMTLNTVNILMFQKVPGQADKVFAEFAVERNATTARISAVRHCAAKETDHTENPIMQ